MYRRFVSLSIFKFFILDDRSAVTEDSHHVSATAKNSSLKESDVNRSGFRFCPRLRPRASNPEFRLRNGRFFLFLSSFALATRGIRDIRPLSPVPDSVHGLSALVCIKNVSISPDCEVVLSRQHMAWNLKGVVKNNAWDFSDDEIERERGERESSCFFLPPETFGITC